MIILIVVKNERKIIWKLEPTIVHIASITIYDYTNCFLHLRTCYNCGKGSHLSYECPQKKSNYNNNYRRENNNSSSSKKNNRQKYEETPKREEE